MEEVFFKFIHSIQFHPANQQESTRLSIWIWKIPIEPGITWSFLAGKLIDCWWIFQQGQRILPQIEPVKLAAFILVQKLLMRGIQSIKKSDDLDIINSKNVARLHGLSSPTIFGKAMIFIWEIHNSPLRPPFPAFSVPRICSSHQCLHCWCYRQNRQTQSGCCPAEVGRWAHHV